MDAISVLFITREPELLIATRTLFKNMGISTRCAASKAEAIHILKTVEMFVVVFDVDSFTEEYQQVIKEVKEQSPVTEIILLVSPETMKCAVEGLKLGISDFLLKPPAIKLLLQKTETASNKARRHNILLKQIGGFAPGIVSGDNFSI